MALTRNQSRVYSTVARRSSLPLSSASMVFEGSAIGIDAVTGRARALVSGDLFAGFAASAASSVNDVTGTNPSDVALIAEGEAQLDVSGVVSTDLGRSVFATDDNSFALTGSTLVGEILRIPSAGKAVVAFVGGRNRMSSSQVSAGQYLVSGEGNVEDLLEMLAAYQAGSLGSLYAYIGTWALLPVANTLAIGVKAIITDYNGAEFRNNGTYWRPAGGVQTLYNSPAGSIAAPVATLTGNGANQWWTLPTALKLPAGMLIPGARIEAKMWMRKSGTHTGQIRADIAVDAAGSTPLALWTGNTNAAAGSTFRGSVEAVVYSGGFFTTGNASWNSLAGGIATPNAADRADANILTEDRYVVFGIGTTYTDSAADLIAYSVAIAG